MRKLLALIFLAASQAFGYYPHTSVGGSEIIGDLQEGLLIPLADFSFSDTQLDKGSPWLKYRSRIFPEAEFVFVRDVFDYPLLLEEYADWFTQADSPFYIVKDRSLVYGGISGTTPMLIQRWESCDSYYFQLFFGRGCEGFCCFVYLPKLAYEDELSYWLNFFNNLPHQIQLLH